MFVLEDMWQAWLITSSIHCPLKMSLWRSKKKNIMGPEESQVWELYIWLKEMGLGREGVLDFGPLCQGSLYILPDKYLMPYASIPLIRIWSHAIVSHDTILNSTLITKVRMWHIKLHGFKCVLTQASNAQGSLKSNCSPITSMPMCKVDGWCWVSQETCGFKSDLTIGRVNLFPRR